MMFLSEKKFCSRFSFDKHQKLTLCMPWSPNFIPGIAHWPKKPVDWSKLETFSTLKE